MVPDGVVDGIGEEADRVGGGGKIEVSSERGERAVRARVVVEHRRDLPRGAGAGHAIDVPAGHGHGHAAQVKEWIREPSGGRFGSMVARRHGAGRTRLNSAASVCVARGRGRGRGRQTRRREFLQIASAGLVQFQNILQN